MSRATVERASCEIVVRLKTEDEDLFEMTATQELMNPYDLAEVDVTITNVTTGSSLYMKLGELQQLINETEARLVQLKKIV